MKNRQKEYFDFSDIILLFFHDVNWGFINTSQKTKKLLHYASETSNEKLVDILLDNDFPVNNVDEEGLSAAFYARNPDMLKKLYKKDTPVVSFKDKNYNIVEILKNFSNVEDKVKMSNAVFDILSQNKNNQSNIEKLYNEKLIEIIESFDTKKSNFVALFKKANIEDINNSIKYEDENKIIETSLLGHVMHKLFHYNSGVKSLNSIQSLWSIARFLLEKGASLDVSVKTKYKIDKETPSFKRAAWKNNKPAWQDFNIDIIGLFIRSLYGKYSTPKMSEKMKQDALIKNVSLYPHDNGLDSFKNNIDLLLFDSKHVQPSSGSFLIFEKKLNYMYKIFNTNIKSNNESVFLGESIMALSRHVEQNSVSDRFIGEYITSKASDIEKNKTIDNIFEDVLSNSNKECKEIYLLFLNKIISSEKQDNSYDMFSPKVRGFIKSRVRSLLNVFPCDKENQDIYKVLLGTLSKLKIKNANTFDDVNKTWADLRTEIEKDLIVFDNMFEYKNKTSISLPHKRGSVL